MNQNRLATSVMLGLAISALIGGLTLAGNANLLQFRNAHLTIGQDWQGLPAEWRAPDGASGYYIVHCKDRITSDVRARLEGHAPIVSYIPVNAYLMKLAAADLNALTQLSDVDWLGIYQPYLKVDLGLFAAERKSGLIKIRLTLFGGEPFEAAEKVIARFSGILHERVDQPHRRRIAFSVPVEACYDAVKELAFLPEVAWIQRYPEYKLCNDYSQWVCQSGPYGGQATPLYDHGVKGASQIVGVMDTGADADMCYFYDSALGMVTPNAPPDFTQRKVVAYIGPAEYVSGWDSNGHGTHTAGTIAGDDFAAPGDHDTGDGIALLAKLVIQDYGDSMDVHPPDDEYSAHQAVYDIGARVHSNSWGWPYEGGVYLDDCEEVDQFIWDNPQYGIVYAAGNEGPYADTIRAPGTAKNVITVGATGSGGVDPENNAYFSSHGPTDDGRRKPDITMPGSDTISAACDYNPSSYNCETMANSGTSMATPGVAGCAALIRDYFVQGFYPLGVPDPTFTLDPSAALVKAIMINSGVNMSGDYTADEGEGHADIPSMGQGWGRVTLDTALYFIGDTRLLYVEDYTDGVSTGDALDYFVAINDSTESLEITLAWSDYPSTPAAALNLVNDLDLTVTIGSEVYKGNVYDLGYSMTGGDYDRLNNVECIHIQNPPVGAVIIRIDGFNIPQGPQPFALVVSGALSFSDGVVSLNSTKYGCEAIATILVSDADLANQGTQDVTIVSTTDPEGETLALVEVNPNSGVFEGSIQFTTAAPGVGQVQVAHDAEVTVTYIDADDGHGGINVPKTDAALIDCVEPIISSVLVQAVSSSTALITWQTDELCTSRVDYGLAVPPDSSVTSSSLTAEHHLLITDLTPCSDYVFSVTSSDAAGNSATDDNAGAFYEFSTLAIYYLVNENMDLDPEWEISGGDWEWGAPTGSGGGGYGSPDPTAGYTGDNVYGYNLDGDYADSMPEYTLTTPILNCSGAQGTTLSYYRWLGVEANYFDHAQTQISTDGITFETLWENGDNQVDDGEWILVTHDISSYADGQPEVYLRWTMGPTDGSVTFCGWNLDDIVVSYEVPCNEPNLAHYSHVIDDSTGDNDGLIDVGETITLPITLRNWGLDATAVSATLSTANPNIAILNAGTTFGDIPQDAIQSSIAPHCQFLVYPSAADDETVVFLLSWVSAETSGTVSFTERLHAPALEYVSNLIQEDAGGDGDGVVDPGEAISMPVVIRNAGSEHALQVSAQLTVDLPTYVTIDQDTVQFGDIPPAGSAESLAPHFHFTTSPTTPDPTVVVFTITMTDAHGVVVVNDLPLEITASTFTRRYFFSMDTDPGWQTEEEWAWGQPAGLDGDPSSGATGPNVYGYNLYGAYHDSMNPAYLTSTAIDCSALFDVEVRYQRWVGVEAGIFDTTEFQVSTDGSDWTTIWSNPSEESMQDADWIPEVFDLSAIADAAATLYLRWVMGPTDGSVTFSGWNLDDIEIWAASAGNVTPTPTSTIEPTVTRTPTVIPTATPSLPPTDTPAPTTSPTSLPSSTPTPTTQPSETPSSIPTSAPSATPECPETGITCELNQTTYLPDDHFVLEVAACNGESIPITVEVYIILDVWGNYWFWPTWTQELDNSEWTLSPCDCHSEIILDFIWPSGAGSAEGIIFWEGLLEPGTLNLIGTIDSCQFDYHE